MSGTRSSTNHPLIGHSQENVPSSSLASEVELLRVVAWYREQPKCQSKGVLSFCCESDRQYVALCLQEGGCMEQDKPCLLQKVKLAWQRAGIAMMGDKSIKEKIKKACEGLKDKLKCLHQDTPAASTTSQKRIIGPTI